MKYISGVVDVVVGGVHYKINTLPIDILRLLTNNYSTNSNKVVYTIGTETPMKYSNVKI